LKRLYKERKRKNQQEIKADEIIDIGADYNTGDDADGTHPTPTDID
jgi:hypothetical protein